MDPVTRFFARHRFAYAVALGCAIGFGAVALTRVFTDRTAAQRIRDLGLTALAASEAGGMLAMRRRVEEERELEAAGELETVGVEASRLG